MLKVKSVFKSFGPLQVLGGVSFSMKAGEKACLVGPNGIGKSTLLKIIAGLETPDSGAVEIGSRSSVAYLGQELPPKDSTRTVREMIEPAHGLFPAREAASICGQLGLPKDFLDRRAGDLSGGEKTKAMLLRILVGRHDIYLLDEPTNNLDWHGLALLERAIAESPAAFLIVSHDRKLLDRTARRTLEFDEFSRTVRSYEVPFGGYLAEREARLTREWAEYSDYREEVSRLTAAARRKKEWGRQGAVQNTRDNDKFIAGKARDYAKGNAAAGKAIERRLSKLEELEKPKERLAMRLSFNQAPRGSDIMLSCSGIAVTFASRKFGPLDLEVGWGERIAIIGPNGAGKTLLAKILSGEMVPEEGKIRRGQGLVLGYLRQELADSKRRAIHEFSPASPEEEGRLRRTLFRFRIGADQVNKPVSELSPGQRSRLVLAKLMLDRANCLLLDEPTNHLDFEALAVLETALADFEGSVIAITHDRYFLERFRPTAVYRCSPGWEMRRLDDWKSAVNG